MKIFKFGGASIRSAEAIKNMVEIIGQYNNDKLLVVVSAMGKTTNSLEEIIYQAYHHKDYSVRFKELHDYHQSIITGLFPSGAAEIKVRFEALVKEFIAQLQKNQEEDYGLYYDQLAGYGELFSSTIVAAYLNQSGIPCTWMDARAVISTDDAFQEAKINWEITINLMLENMPSRLENSLVLTQGFIGKTKGGLTTTLGREGSDFTAAIFAFCLKAESVTIWKDVPGVLNADPKIVRSAVKFDELSYNEAAEMTYYGANVIHPKTIKPLANQKIPLLVRSFEHPREKGTIIHDCIIKNLPPTIVFKPRQCLISFQVKDLTFINENNLSIIFHVLDKLNIKLNMMQNSAVSFSICIDYQEQKIERLLKMLQNDFRVRYNEDLTLISVKNYDQFTIDQVSKQKNILLEQKTRHTYQIVVI
ncbi:MAG: aspartate kinase [Candidatus Cyclobacteriaceae bacterium M3_2C_046]